MENATILLPQAVNGILSFPNMVRNRMTVNAGVIFESAKSNFGTSEFRPLSGRWVVERNNIFHYVFCGTKVTIASATRRASLSACFGHNGAPLLPHCANKSARRLTARPLTYIVEPALKKRDSADDDAIPEMVVCYGCSFSRVWIREPESSGGRLRRRQARA